MGLVLLHLASSWQFKHTYCLEQNEKIQNAGLAAPGLMLLVAGVVAIAFNGQAASSHAERESQHSKSLQALLQIPHKYLGYKKASFLRVIDLPTRLSLLNAVCVRLRAA